MGNQSLVFPAESLKLVNRTIAEAGLSLCLPSDVATTKLAPTEPRAQALLTVILFFANRFFQFHKFVVFFPFTPPFCKWNNLIRKHFSLFVLVAQILSSFSGMALSLSSASLEHSGKIEWERKDFPRILGALWGRLNVNCFTLYSRHSDAPLRSDVEQESEATERSSKHV